MSCCGAKRLKKILSKYELKVIESKIDEISKRAEILDSTNSFEARILDADDAALDYYLSVLERSYRKARIEESGFKLVTL